MDKVYIDLLPFVKESLSKHLEENWEEKYQREDSLLTDNQRQFIGGLTEYGGKNARQQRYQMRERIRRRYVDGLSDLKFLNQLDQSSREKIVTGLGEDELRRVAATLIQFIYQETSDQKLIEEIVETAIYIAEVTDPSLGDSTVPPIDVEVEISSEYPPDYDALYERAQENGISSLRTQEIAHLIEDHRLSPEDLEQFYEEDNQNDGDKHDADRLAEAARRLFLSGRELQDSEDENNK